MKHLYPISLFVLLVCGCSSTSHNQIGAFALATQGITEQVDQVLVDINKGQVSKLLTEGAAKYGTGEEPLTRSEIEKIVPIYDVKSTKALALYQANDALTKYAKGLQNLADAVSQVEIDYAAANLAASMSSANTSYVELTGNANLYNKDDLSIVSTAIAAIGTAYVEKKRQEALKKIITQADPKIKIITDELVKQLDETYFQSVLVSQRSTYVKVLIRDFNVHANDKPLPLEESVKRMNDIFDAHTVMATTHINLKKTQKSLLGIQKAHAALAKEVAKDLFDGPGIVAIIGELKDQWKHYGDYRDLVNECNGTYTIENAPDIEEITTEGRVIVCKEKT